MATRTKDSKGWRFLFVGADGKRRTIRVAALSDKGADDLLALVETLARCANTGESVDAKTARRVAELPDPMHAKLATVGLVAPRVVARRVTLTELWDRFLAARTVGPATTAVYARVRKSLEGYFTPTRPIADIGPEQAEGWCRSLADAQLARATQSKLAHVAKAVFARAVRWELLLRSPFASIKPGPQVNADRQRYISLADLDRILSACPSDRWRIVFGMARLAGIRVPSELAGLTWGDVNFETGRMTIRSPKTAHHADGQSRVVPMVPRLRAILIDAFHRAEPGTVPVVPGLTGPGSNLRTHALRILARAGVQPPQKLFVNCRSSCGTDWASEYGGAAAARWLGHSAQVAVKHYHQVRPEDFDRAAGVGAYATEPTNPAVARPVAQSVAHSGAQDPSPDSADRVCGAVTGGDDLGRVGKWAQQDSNLKRPSRQRRTVPRLAVPLAVPRGPESPGSLPRASGRGWGCERERWLIDTESERSGRLAGRPEVNQSDPPDGRTHERSRCQWVIASPRLGEESQENDRLRPPATSSQPRRLRGRRSSSTTQGPAQPVSGKTPLTPPPLPLISITVWPLTPSPTGSLPRTRPRTCRKRRLASWSDTSQRCSLETPPSECWPPRCSGNTPAWPGSIGSGPSPPGLTTSRCWMPPSTPARTSTVARYWLGRSFASPAPSSSSPGGR